MKYIWSIDTPRNKKGVLSVPADFDENKIKVNDCSFVSVNTLISLGWIKPVEENKELSQILTRLSEVAGFSKPIEEKKLTEEEILEAITYVVGHHEVSARRLAKFLAEHLK